MWIEPLGWMLVQSVWLIALIVAGASLLLSQMRRATAQARYVVTGVAMLLSVSALPAAFVWEMTTAPAPATRNDAAHADVAPTAALPMFLPGDSQQSLPGIQKTANALINTQETPASDSDIAPTTVKNTAPLENESTATSSPNTRWREWEARLQPYLSWLVSGWLVGVGVLSLRPMIGWRESRHLRRIGCSGVSEAVTAKVRRLSERLHLRQLVDVFESSLVQVPCVVGAFKPVILLPASTLTGLTIEQLEAVLAHELAHVRRYDYVINIGQTLIETWLFYHPAIWWLSQRMRLEREYCCDDLAISVVGDADYCRALLAVEQLRQPQPLLALGVTDGSLVSRVRRIVHHEPEAPLNPWPRFSFSVLALLLITAGLTTSIAQTPAASPQPPTSDTGTLPTATESPAEAAPSPTAPSEKPAPQQPNALPAPDPAKSAVARGIAFLKRQQQADGTWQDNGAAKEGLTALTVCSLLQAGVPTSDPDLKQALDFLRTVEPQGTYAVSLQTVALCKANPREDAALIRRNVDWLQRAQSGNGGWRYVMPPANSRALDADGSNTRFAVWALDEASRSGCEVKRETWEKVRQHWLDTQTKDGGFGYTVGAPPTSTMTLAGVGCLATAAQHLAEKKDGPLASEEVLRRAIAWLSTNNPDSSRGRYVPTEQAAWVFYHAQILEWASGAARIAKFAERDWKTEITQLLLDRARDDGSWTGAAETSLIATSFALLTLTGTSEPNSKTTAAADAPWPAADELRALAQQHFARGNYAAMEQAYVALVTREIATPEDAWGLGQARLLLGRTREAAESFELVLTLADQRIVTLQQQTGPTPEQLPPEDDRRFGGIKRDWRQERDRELARFAELWPQWVLLAGQVRLHLLSDAAAAAKTLQRGLRFVPEAESLEALLQDAQAAVASKPKPFDQQDRWRTWMYPLATQRSLALAYSQLGEHDAAARCWCRIQMSSLAYQVGMTMTQAETVTAAINKVPIEQRQPFHEFVRQHPGRQKAGERAFDVPQRLQTDARNPFEVRSRLDGFEMLNLGPSQASVTKLKNGSWLMAYTGGNAFQARVMFARSTDGKNWEQPYEFSHNSIFPTRSPAVIEDDEGTLWLVCSSQRWEASRYSSGGYQWWACSSQDGRNWSTPKPLLLADGRPFGGQYQHTLQLTRDRNGKFWVFSNGLAGSTTHLSELPKLSPLKLSLDKDAHITSSFATFDAQNVCHLVITTHAAMSATSSTDLENWRPLQVLARPEKNQLLEHPRLLIDGERFVLVHESSWGRFLTGRLKRSDTEPLSIEVTTPTPILLNLEVSGSLVTRDGDNVLMLAHQGYENSPPVLLSARWPDLFKEHATPRANETQK